MTIFLFGRFYMLIKFLKPLFLPSLFFLLSVFLYSNIEHQLATYRNILLYAAYGFLFLGMVLSYRFNNSRLFFFLFILAICLYVLSHYVFQPSTHSDAILKAVSLIIPFNLLCFTFLKERGFFTSWGLLRFGFIFFQFVLLFWFIATSNDFYTKLIHLQIVKLNPSPLPQLAWFIFSAAAFTLIAKKVTSKSAFEGYLLMALFSTFYALPKYELITVSFFFAMSGIVLAIAIIHHSFKMSYLDELTGLPTRRALKEDLLKLGNKYAIAMVDIDFFKKFNDTYGHDVGDEVLKLVASLIKNVPGGGKAFRYGGEEFTILFPGKTLSEVLPRLEELREKVQNRGFTLRGKDRPKRKPKQSRPTTKTTTKQLHITISIGVAEKNSRHRSPEEVIKAADTALYRAKKSGRNCVSK